MIDYEELAEAMGDLDEDTVKELLETVMADGGSGAQQAMDACQKGMDIVGSRFESGEYFVGDLIYAGELMTDAVSILKDALVTGDGGGTKTKMILCTVKDDLHDIGKNIVRSMLEAAGFEVLDLGIDVPASEIVKAAKENSIKIVALSGVLTLAIDSMKATVEAFKADGMDDVKIIIGGAPVPILPYRKREIHTVFLRFRYFDWPENLSPTALADLIRGSLSPYISRRYRRPAKDSQDKMVLTPPILSRYRLSPGTTRWVRWSCSASACVLGKIDSTG